MSTPLDPRSLSEADTGFLRQALTLAEGGIGLTDPNPRVGCVIVTADGRVVGRGHTQEAGGAHAEIMALRDAASNGESVLGASVYVTLEPCAHHGRTPPCCDALTAAGVGRVVSLMSDPNPLVAGQGLVRLRAAGIAVTEWPADAVQAEAHELNIGFFSRMTRGRPWVRMKAAMSLDGRTALLNGASQWITGTAARADGHAWRKRAGAVLTGVGTVIDDDPRLDVRLVPTAHQPQRVIVDSRLRTPPASRVLDAPGRALIYTIADAAEARCALERRGAEVARLPSRDGRVDLEAVLADLAARGVNELHVEAGQRLNGSLVREGRVDEYLLYVAPRLLGPGRDMASIEPLSALSDAVQLEWRDIAAVGPDLRLLARPRS